MKLRLFLLPLLLFSGLCLSACGSGHSKGYAVGWNWVADGYPLPDGMIAGSAHTDYKGNYVAPCKSRGWIGFLVTPSPGYPNGKMYWKDGKNYVPIPQILQGCEDAWKASNSGSAIYPIK